jgi:TolB protein
MKARLVVSLFVISSVAVPLLSATPAGATFPGTNGRIAFFDFLQRPFQIHTIDPDGTDSLQLTTGTRRQKVEPAWSADGTMIAFASARVQRDARGRLEIMNADGTSRSVVVAYDGRRQVFDPAWSPDGSQIAFCRATPRNLGIWVVDVDGTNLTGLTGPDDFDCTPDWSPDGSMIAFTSYGDGAALWVMDADGTNRMQLSKSNGANPTPSWSPDGSMIAFIRRRSGTQEVFVVNADGSGRTRLTQTERRWEWTPAWSPDGSSIAFCKGASLGPSAPCDIWIMDPDGSNATRITTTPDVDEFQLSWQAT